MRRFPESKVCLHPECEDLRLSEWIPKPVSYLDHEFSFLNRSKSFSGSVEWKFQDYGLLWNYNLNYMDYLLQPRITKEEGMMLIGEFIAKQDDNIRGMDPYPISLRGINWIKFLSAGKINNRYIDHSLCRQYNLLNKNIEYHLLGNHLIENGFSLLFGAYYFKNETYFRKASRIIHGELIEQVLSDGGHFELSPMYHRIVLERLLDCINLVQNNEKFKAQDELLKIMLQKAESMLKWMNTLIFSNGTMPLLNDSSNGVAPSSYELNEYALSLGLTTGDKTDLKDSGYQVIEGLNYKVIADVGNIGATYQPGHAHADTLSFELYLRNKPLIVDTGVSTYEKDHRRHVERSTISHNTVEVDNQNSSEVWGGFRVGRRATIILLASESGSIKARHDGYRRSGVVHEREFIKRFEKFIINDLLIARNEAKGISRFHFHPDVQIESDGSSVSFSGGRLEFENAGKVSIADYFYAPEFNKTIPAKVVEVSFVKNLKSSFQFQGS
jgi:hypothetical protein